MLHQNMHWRTIYLCSYRLTQSSTVERNCLVSNLAQIYLHVVLYIYQAVRLIRTTNKLQDFPGPYGLFSSPFQDQTHFPGLSTFLGHGNFRKKFQDFPVNVGALTICADSCNASANHGYPHITDDITVWPCYKSWICWSFRFLRHIITCRQVFALFRNTVTVSMDKVTATVSVRIGYCCELNPLAAAIYKAVLTVVFGWLASYR